MLILRCGVNLGNLHGRPAVVLVNLHGKIVFEDIGGDGILSGLFPVGLARIHFLEFFEVLPEDFFCSGKERASVTDCIEARNEELTFAALFDMHLPGVAAAGDGHEGVS